MTNSIRNLPRDFQSARGSEVSGAIDISHLSWEFDPVSTPHVTGNVTSRAIGPLRVSWLRVSLSTNEWRGERTAANIRTNPEPYLTFVMPLDDSIVLTAPVKSAVIAQDELAIWDSTQPMRFKLKTARYEQISVLVPQRLLRATPEACSALHCAHVDKNNVLSELCVQHMATLAKFLDSELRPYEMSLSSVTTSLFDAVIASLYKAPRDRELLANEIKNYIECYITDETLSPKTIAEAFEISTRYVHKLFEHDGSTIGEWILNRRLDRSAGDLLEPDASITDTAFKWGFKDLGHYSRSFKSRFGVPPSTYRRVSAQNS